MSGWEEPEQCNDCGEYFDPEEVDDDRAVCPDCRED